MSDFTFPDDLHYDREHHMWVRQRSGGEVAIGIDPLGLENLGDLAYVTLAEIGAVVRRGEPLGTLEAAKMTGDIVSPVGGRVVARNQGAVESPALVNRDPYGEGWLVVLEPSEWSSDASALIHGDAVAGWVEEELARYRREGWLD